TPSRCSRASATTPATTSARGTSGRGPSSPSRREASLARGAEEREADLAAELLPRGELGVELVRQDRQRPGERAAVRPPCDDLLLARLRVELDAPRALADAERLLLVGRGGEARRLLGRLELVRVREQRLEPLGQHAEDCVLAPFLSQRDLVKAG